MKKSTQTVLIGAGVGVGVAVLAKVSILGTILVGAVAGALAGSTVHNNEKFVEHLRGMREDAEHLRGQFAKPAATGDAPNV